MDGRAPSLRFFRDDGRVGASCVAEYLRMGAVLGACQLLLQQERHALRASCEWCAEPARAHRADLADIRRCGDCRCRCQEALARRIARWLRRPCGEAEYLRIDLAAGTSTLERADDLDSTWSSITTTFPKNVTVIKDLPEKSLERKFLEAVLAYERGHRMEIAAQTKKTLTTDDLKRMEEHEREDLTASLLGGSAQASEEKAQKDHGAKADRKGGE